MQNSYEAFPLSFKTSLKTPYPELIPFLPIPAKEAL